MSEEFPTSPYVINVDGESLTVTGVHQSERDRLAADLRSGFTNGSWYDHEDEAADRLIALGWTRLDEERLARALRAAVDTLTYIDLDYTFSIEEDIKPVAAAIAKAYREDTP